MFIIQLKLFTCLLVSGKHNFHLDLKNIENREMKLPRTSFFVFLQSESLNLKIPFLLTDLCCKLSEIV